MLPICVCPTNSKQRRSDVCQESEKVNKIKQRPLKKVKRVGSETIISKDFTTSRLSLSPGFHGAQQRL